APHICDFWDRASSAANYDDGSTFQIGRIDMVANTGTYLDTPFHRYEDGDDLAAVGLERLTGLEGLCVRAERMEVGAELFEALDVAGKAVLVHTGWDRHWRTDSYHSAHPFLAEAAARLLAERGAALVGIDSYNIDDTRTRRRPVHTVLLGAGTLIVEHMTRLGELPGSGFRFTAAPPKVSGMGTFPVRAFAEIG
ncbi:MAG TPA: cyclase family protein, partial [Allosphingosinicella sp.]